MPNFYNFLYHEKSLHAALKAWYAQSGDQLEASVEGCVIDIVRGDLLIEIQMRNFAALKREMRRKLREESGIEIEVGELLDVADHILSEEDQHWVSPSFICTIVSGEPAIREKAKCIGIGWFAPDEMPEDLTQVTRTNLMHYRQHKQA